MGYEAFCFDVLEYLDLGNLSGKQQLKNADTYQRDGTLVKIVCRFHGAKEGLCIDKKRPAKHCSTKKFPV